MIRWGITANSHDASIAVFDNENLLFAAHSERSTGKKNDAYLNQTIIDQALEFGEPDEVHWYENHWLKRLRQIRSGQYKLAFNKPTPIATMLPYGIHQTDWLSKSISDGPLAGSRFINHKHHNTHAAAGWYTAPFDKGAVIVIDAIGEFETLTLWQGEGNKLTKVRSQGYPHSIGLWYSAMTQRCGLKPNEEEYILMGMAAVGDPNRFKDKIFNDFFEPLDYTGKFEVKFKHDLHRGCRWWEPELNTMQDIADIAAGTQAVYEMVFEHLLVQAKIITGEDNVVLMGGCALNCVANGLAGRHFGRTWIMPNPGDAGSAVGAVLDHIRIKVPYTTPYLGYEIKGKYPIQAAMRELLDGGMVGVANGKAEFGPRALGNRSLIADPRGQHMKDKVNSVKRRQAFRPFAPMIKLEKVHDYFEMPPGCEASPYMQFVGRCKFPDEYPAITHLDGTSRVQTVTREDHPELYELLTVWEEATGCPILLNTSLNIKGEPMVDNEQDAQRWHEKYGVPVVTEDD
jgi:carbamoyltransferase